MKRVRRFVSAQELAYYQEHFREAIREDAVVCLECGCLLRDLNTHLRFKHELSTDEYREHWGYNRKTALNIPAVSALRTQRALERNLPAKAPKDAIYKAHEANRHHRVPRRKEMRLDHAARIKARLAADPSAYRTWKVRDEVLKAMVQQGLPPREIASRTELSFSHTRRRLYTLGLLKPTRPRPSEVELLNLLRQGLWPREIAAKSGRDVSSIRQRLQRLRRRGVAVPCPTGLRPNAKRKVTDDQIIALAQTGLRQADMARRAGFTLSSLERRLRALRRRGLLPPTAPFPRISDDSIIVLAHQGLGSTKIASRLGISRSYATVRLRKLRQRGLLPPFGPSSRITTERITALAQQGLGATRIGRGLGISRSAIAHRLSSLRRRGLLPLPPAIAPAPDEQIIAYARQGLGAPTIAHRLRINQNIVSYRLRVLRGRGLLPQHGVIKRVPDERILTLAQQGLRRSQMASQLGISGPTLRRRLAGLRRSRLLPPFRSTRQAREESVIRLARRSVGSTEIARRLGVSRSTIVQQLRSLRQRGLVPPSPRISRELDNKITAFAQKRLGGSKIARRLRMTQSTVWSRLRSLRQRGLLPRPAPIPRLPDESIIALAYQGLSARKIARRLGTHHTGVLGRIKSLRQRGLLPSVQRPQGASPPTTPSPPHQA